MVVITRFFGYDFIKVQVFDVPALRASKRSTSSSNTIVEFPAHRVRWHCEIQLPGILSGQSEWHEFGGATASVSRGVVIVVDPPVLDALELLFERYAGWTRDIKEIKPKMQKELGTVLRCVDGAAYEASD